MASNQPAELKSCGVLVFREQPEFSFLLMRHADRWDLPKGHLDPGETEIQCALRELVEETAITADDIQMDPNFRFSLFYPVRLQRIDQPRRKKQLVVFLAKLRRQIELVLTEHVGYEWRRWTPPHQIQRNTIDPLLQALERYWQEHLPWQTD